MTKANGIADGSGAAVRMKPVAPQGSVTLEEATELEAGQDFMLGEVGTIKLGFGWSAPGIDVDASLAMYTAKGDCVDVIWWDKKTSRLCSIKHMGDDMTGEKAGDNEFIEINLDEVPFSIHYMLAVVSVYSKGKTLKDVGNPTIKVIDVLPSTSKISARDLASFNPKLEENDMPAAVMGVMTRKGAWWNFKALGMAGRGRTIKEIVFNTPLTSLVEPSSVDAEQRGVHIWAVEAKEVAASDLPMFGPKTSDCFVEIICRENRAVSEVVEKSLNPKWNMPKVYLGETTEADTTIVEVNLWDHDTHTEDDFLGSVYLTLGGLAQKGVGVHELSFPLDKSLDKNVLPKEGVGIKGDIVLKCEITVPQK